MTVSRVINGKRNVRESTRQAVLRAIDELNYSPNAAARTLAAGEITHIGLLYANPSAAYLSQFLVGALEGARKTGAHLVLEACQSENASQQVETARQSRRSANRSPKWPKRPSSFWSRTCATAATK
jgi:LacI family transcriptional regulator